MAWAIIAASVVSAGAGIYGSKEASDASKRGSNAAIDEQRRQYDTTMGLLEPTRALGYGAQSDLASLYGYRLPAYTPLNELTRGTAGTPAGSVSTTDPFVVQGRRADGGYGTSIGGIGWNSGSHQRRFGGAIDPITGAVNLTNIKNAKRETRLEDAATAYLRGEADTLKGKKLRRIRDAIDEMREAGYVYDPNAANAQPEPTAGPIAPQQYFDPLDPNSDPNLPPRPAGTSADGTAGNFDRFFASPDYRFRQQEGTRAIDRSAAARGGVLGGNTLRAQTDYASNLAAGEYGNYVNRLLAMAGLGQTATNTAATVGANTSGNVSNYLQSAGDARASGIMGAANSVTNAVNGGLNSWLWLDYLKKRA